MQLGKHVNACTFQGVGGSNEYFITVQAPPDVGFDRQMQMVQQDYAEAQRALGLDAQSAVFRRIFLSDVINQIAPTLASPLVREAAHDPVAVSIIEQPPLPGGKVALLAYHISGSDPIEKSRLSPHDVALDKDGLRHLWTTRLCAAADQPGLSARMQTRHVFDALTATLKQQAATLRDHCVRTWLYLKDVDVFYHDMVEERSAQFVRHGLTEETHYIASTGIEGACAHQYDVVAMDAYSVVGLKPEQLSFLNDYDHLCATKDYNVTFERGTRISYADRSHFFISGTASIDRHGQVVHPRKVDAQLDQAMNNVEALLRAGDATLADMAYWIVYLRDPTDFPRISARMEERFPGIPTVFVRGAVCRPEWLVEVEGIGVAPTDQPQLPGF